MGASASVNTIVSNINNRVENSLTQEASASATANCNVEIGSITFKSTKGCVVEVSNLCSAQAEASVDAVVNATIDFYNDLSFEQKQEAPAWFTAAFGVNTTTTNITNDFKNIVEQRCKADAVLNSSITVNNITVADCVAPESEGVIKFTFTNSGTAAGQCAISALLDLQVAGSNTVSAKQTTGTDWTVIFAYVALVAGIAIIAGIFYYIYKLRLSPKDKVNIELAKLGATSSKIIQLSQYLRG
ncbi:ORF MSV183 putative myristylated membrane protein, Molluscum contagiosum virus MC069R (vaccinia L1R) homolog, similar to GB:U60315 [Melanoplus sanguinipes entomopoxvirus]|uniref:ORF MSV183 putative myristylated membrane protein, Molluscum contagiosum virus MC069R (Vaccinia L1R) homolog, similar to GB:U60315 n=1 Tax=Melanoplus sanguinipes entomopoxvirus TaxID=83191 RepID=Q9YVQ9_MSEPV|nr:ORF MSV183 putative myristylated membrane protein, Molluscum contagiosum virus MC069R (vaccinia L1R) homolog, similar to GB:U60315 [Melanoplus sanguinipes entomopoxvirus]AAC97691.1 ORF MSV183 putative myristylated membrane protein, Molluscum contagiosum virus MC069R (vaccinia L1R) homolog, similar to GB:U60315 [Melanoplus sanguinipes entomopoxvirus 'O']